CAASNVVDGPGCRSGADRVWRGEIPGWLCLAPLARARCREPEPIYSDSNPLCFPELIRRAVRCRTVEWVRFTFVAAKRGALRRARKRWRPFRAEVEHVGNRLECVAPQRCWRDACGLRALLPFPGRRRGSHRRQPNCERMQCGKCLIRTRPVCRMCTRR